MRSSISAQSCDSVPPAPGWMATMASASSCSLESFIVSSMALTSVSSWPTSVSMSVSTLSPSFFSSWSTPSSSHFESIDWPEEMRFSTRARLRPTFCAFSWSSQKPGADISRSISSSDLRAEATSKIAPDGAEPDTEVVDAGGCVVSHISQCKMQNAKCKIASGSFCILNFEFCICRQADDNCDDSEIRKPISKPHIRRHGLLRRELRQQNPFVPHRYFLP